MAPIKKGAGDPKKVAKARKKAGIEKRSIPETYKGGVKVIKEKHEDLDVPSWLKSKPAAKKAEAPKKRAATKGVAPFNGQKSKWDEPIISDKTKAKVKKAASRLVNRKKKS